MKDKKYIIFIVFQILFLIAFLLKVFGMKDLVPLFTMLTAILNMCLLAYIFNKEHEFRDASVRNEKISYWYRNNVIDKDIDRIDEIYSHYAISVKEIKDEDDLVLFIRENYQPRKRGLIIKMHKKIRIIDEGFANYLDEFLDEEEDNLTKELENILSKDAKERKKLLEKFCDDNVFDYKAKYIGKLYNYEIKGYKI